MSGQPQHSRAIMLSIQPEHARNILEGTKTAELRRRFPVGAGGACVLLYASSPTCAVVGAVRIVRVHRLPLDQLWRRYQRDACVSRGQFTCYFAGLMHGTAIMLSDAVRFREPVPLANLRDVYDLNPVLSYRYIDGRRGALLKDRRIRTPLRVWRGPT